MGRREGDQGGGAIKGSKGWHLSIFRIFYVFAFFTKFVLRGVKTIIIYRLLFYSPWGLRAGGRGARAGKQGVKGLLAGKEGRLEFFFFQT